MKAERPSQIITLIQPTFKQTSSQVSPPVSPSASLSRRRKKAVIVTKTKEELIYQSYQQLTDYIQKFDSEVKRVVESYESEFLNAYREHTKNVRKELNQIKKNSLEVMQEQQHFVDRIEVLEKELILFREESLKLSEKNIELTQEVQRLNFELKQSREEVMYMERSLASAIKENKRAAVLLSSLKDHSQDNKSFHHQALKISCINRTIPTTELSHLQNKTEERPSTMSVRFNNKRIRLGIQSMKKERIQLKDQKEEKVRFTESEKKATELRQTNKDIQIMEEVQEKVKSEHLSERKTGFGVRYKMNSQKNNKKKMVEDELKRLKSQEFASRNEYQKIFVDCVEQVRKQVLRKNGITGLNYFKSNSPKSFQQFKQIDYHLILFLFLKNEQIMHVLFDIIFSSQLD